MPSWVTKSRQLVAHRGNPWDHPENTRISILSALELGADVIEFDVSVTSDNIPIALHGPRLQKSTTGHGRVKDFSWHEISNYRALDRNGESSSEPIPMVKDLLREFGTQTFWNLDIKDPRAVPLISSMLDEFSLNGRSVLSGLNVKQVLKVSSEYPDINLLVNLSRLDKIFLLSRFFRKRWVAFRFSEIAKCPSVVGINIHWRYVNQELVTNLHSLETEIWTFTVDKAIEIDKLFSLGVNSVTTNRPALCLSNLP